MSDADSRLGLRYAAPEVVAFVDALHAPHDRALAAAFSAPEEHAFPSIQIAQGEGRLIELLSAMLRVRRAVEIGTLTGYSATRLARGLAPGGCLWTIERDLERARVARARIRAAGLAERVEVLVGEASVQLAELAKLGPFDLVFIDADKGRYDVYGRWAHQHLRVGGVMLADNAYFFGRLLDDEPAAEAMRRFHREARDRFETACIPTPDGLLIAQKVAE